MTKLPNNTEIEKENLDLIKKVTDDLRGIFILDPIPSAMRNYERITDIEIRPNGENVSPVLYHMCKDRLKKEQLLDIICRLPENEVMDIEFITTKLGDVIFGLKERYMSSSELVDAKKLSDGTLRCIAIVSAILTMKENGTIVVEEIDNGIHPSRVLKLIECLKMIGKSRKIDIILTTHNASLLNQYDREKLMGVSIIYRDKENGTSKFTPFVEMKQSSKVLAAGGLGAAMLNDSLNSLVKESRKTVDYSWLGV